MLMNYIRYVVIYRELGLGLGLRFGVRVRVWARVTVRVLGLGFD